MFSASSHVLVLWGRGGSWRIKTAFVRPASAMILCAFPSTTAVTPITAAIVATTINTYLVLL